MVVLNSNSHSQEKQTQASFSNSDIPILLKTMLPSSSGAELFGSLDPLTMHSIKAVDSWADIYGGIWILELQTLQRHGTEGSTKIIVSGEK